MNGPLRKLRRRLESNPGLVIPLLALLIAALNLAVGIARLWLEIWEEPSIKSSRLLLSELGPWIIVATLSGIILYNYRQRKKQALASPAKFFYYSTEDLGRLFRQRRKEGINDVRLFAYTSETLTDYIPFKSWSEWSLSLRILLRDWTLEREDEEKYNQRKEVQLGMVRPWKKWKELEALAKKYARHEEKKLSVKVEVRYYSAPPLFKGMIWTDKKKGLSEAFLGLYEWQKSPQGGGSQYKGVGTSVLYLRSDGKEHEKVLLERLASQFDRIWESSRTFEEVKGSDRGP